MVPGTGHSSHHQQREMRRSSSEQAPCTLPTELPEMRSKSFDYGNLSTSRQGEIYSSASAMKERRRGYLIRQVEGKKQLFKMYLLETRVSSPSVLLVCAFYRLH